LAANELQADAVADVLRASGVERGAADAWATTTGGRRRCGKCDCRGFRPFLADDIILFDLATH